MRIIDGTNITSLVDNNLGHCRIGFISAGGATLPTTAGLFATGCQITDLSTSLTWTNIGTQPAPVWATQEHCMQALPATIATSGNTDTYLIVPETGVLAGIDFSGKDALAANDTNYITFSVTNLGQAGAGSTALLAATDTNTTKATGGTALAANTKRSLSLSTVANALNVTAGDRLLVRAAATGTLANTVTFPVFLFRFNQSLK